MKFVYIFLFFVSNLFAENQLSFEVGKAKVKRNKAAFIISNTKPQNKYTQELLQRIKFNLEFADFFDVVAEQDKDGVGKTDYVNFINWKESPYDFLVKIDTETSGDVIKTKAFVYDVTTKTQLFGKEYVGKLTLAVKISQQMSDQILATITGRPSEAFYTRFAFVCNKGTGRGDNIQKEIYMTDWDNSYSEKLTSRKSLVFSPSFSKDGKFLVFSSYANMEWGQNLNLYLADLSKKSYKVISQRKGLHVGPRFHPSGKAIAVTMSFTGNPQLYLIDLDGKIQDLIAKSWGFNVEVDISPDGNKMAFVSGRSGKPMVYYKSISDQGNGEQLTFAGAYNSHPHFSPDGSTILFSSWIENKFDLFSIKTNKTNLERLTTGSGSNEEAVYSPDGNFIAFTSNRSGKKLVYIMNSLATKIRVLSPSELGECDQPAWGRVF